MALSLSFSVSDLHFLVNSSRSTTRASTGEREGSVSAVEGSVNSGSLNLPADTCKTRRGGCRQDDAAAASNPQGSASIYLGRGGRRRRERLRLRGEHRRARCTAAFITFPGCRFPSSLSSTCQRNGKYQEPAGYRGITRERERGERRGKDFDSPQKFSSNFAVRRCSYSATLTLLIWLKGFNVIM